MLMPIPMLAHHLEGLIKTNHTDTGATKQYPHPSANLGRNKKSQYLHYTYLIKHKLPSVWFKKDHVKYSSQSQ
jgi:hypothetical protein